MTDEGEERGRGKKRTRATTYIKNPSNITFGGKLEVASEGGPKIALFCNTKTPLCPSHMARVLPEGQDVIHLPLCKLQQKKQSAAFQQKNHKAQVRLFLAFTPILVEHTSPPH